MVLSSFINAVVYNNTTAQSDTDIIRNIIQNKKFDNLLSVNGDFCGATKQDNKWVLFRDHMGIMPLYYYLKDNQFYFAEDMRELCAISGVDLSINEKWFYLMMTGRSTLSPRETEFKYIFAVCPGTWTEFTLTNNYWNIKENFYWRPGQKKTRYKTDIEYINELRRLIESAVNIRLEKYPGKIGAEASGGLDSSVIDILIGKANRDVLFASWSIPYDVIPKKSLDERQVVEDVCNSIGKSFEFIPFEDSEICDCMSRYLPPCANTLQLSKTAKLMSDNGVSVIFTGHGGDEGVSHRANIVELWHCGEYGAYIKENWNSTNGQKLRLLRTAKRIVIGLLKTLPRLKSGWQNETYDLSCCMNSDFLKAKKDIKTPPLHFAFDPLQYVLNGGSRSRIDNCDVQAKDFGVKYLFPFLDYRVIDFALSIPRRMYIHNGQNRYIFREAFKDIMPKSLYEVNYKDFPSLRRDKKEAEDLETQEINVDKSEEIIDKQKQKENQQEWTDLQLSQLDWDRWNKYLDKSNCEDFLMSDFDELSEDDIARIKLFTSRLYTCSLVQNLQDNANKWKELQSAHN